MEKPEIIENPDLKNLKATCQTVLNEWGETEDNDDDMHSVTEAAMEALFGKDVYKYLNSLT